MSQNGASFFRFLIVVQKFTFVSFDGVFLPIYEKDEYYKINAEKKKKNKWMKFFFEC